VDVYLIVLRIVHILAGVFWVGSAILFFFFIEPTANELGPAAGPFLQGMTVKRKLPIFLTAASGLTVLAGVLLYWQVSGGFDLNWITSSAGLTFTIGGLAAVAAFLGGLLGIKPRVERMGAIGAAVQESGGPPSAEQAAELERIQHSLRAVGRLDLGFLTVAVIAMAIARYV